MNRIIIEKHEETENNSAQLCGYKAEHIIKVLRAKIGDKVKIGCLNGPKGYGIITEINEKSVLLKCEFEDGIPNPPSVDLIIALPRPKVMRRLWAQLSAVGVGRIVLVNAEKVERQYFDNTWLKEEVYKTELIHGLEQSGETYLPQVFIKKRLKTFIEDELDTMFNEHQLFIAEPLAVKTDFRKLHLKKKIVVAIGPEGGWTTFEKQMFKEHGFIEISLGCRILRSDTVSVVVAGLFNFLL